MLSKKGFAADIIEVPLLGESKTSFKNEIAYFDLARNTLTLDVVQSIYSNREPTVVTFERLELPPTLYENDASLLIWNQDYDGILGNVQSIEKSPTFEPGGFFSFWKSRVVVSFFSDQRGHYGVHSAAVVHCVTNLHEFGLFA